MTNEQFQKKVDAAVNKAIKAERARITAGIREAGAKIAADEAFCKNGKKGGAAATKAALAVVKGPVAETA